MNVAQLMDQLKYLSYDWPDAEVELVAHDGQRMRLKAVRTANPSEPDDEGPRLGNSCVVRLMAR